MIENMSVKQINEIVSNLEINEYLKYIDILKNDKRASVQKIALKLSKKLDDIRKEEIRLQNMKIFENEAYKRGFRYIGGIDEAGRGPLAGPVVAAVVVLSEDTIIKGINDSKKLSLKKRQELFDIIKEKAIDYGIGIVDNNEIDKLNILNATYEAMKKALFNLKNTPDYLLIDALTIPNINIPQKPIIEGDRKSISISAASILAKVTRDKIMEEYDKLYPQYKFAKHKGYGTKEHYEAIKIYGITPIHRKTFLKSILNGELDENHKL
ncbi:RNase HII [Alkalithermobacter thermoalcaliphilus JW-YL-7 = DSM 7308]|uniref:Ribonuclease HII n=1 Tax=Alkalithermobacter thermoalcaliphilus JW-YL-7 = DSM 7308 TaxID=1121328 RepID=A0A150FR35_CLOPD|nr:Ribonuclease HII [[Clostridium] paradoxum JW-YL-7 = DSM 7308]SHL12059.1 RNase HII [[Clostridium] paradoxum JW-YL-7 = DSM 7308]